MPTTVTATAGEDSLCNIAMRAGFFDCAPLRAEPANAAFLTRDLQDGDIVTVPDVVIKEESRPSEARHRFQLKTAPPMAIRFVHGSPDKPYRDDVSLAHLNVSNFISNKAGTDGQKVFPTGFGFHRDGHADPDSFKVEVVDPNGAGELEVELEALKPKLAADGSLTGHESFTDPQANLRKIKLKCKKVGSATYKGYRSRYLRLVTDEEDLKTISGNPPRGDGTAQGLFASDMADGNNGDADKVEILDQLVQATYENSGCTAAVPNKCKVRAKLPIGPNRQRIRVCFHLFRTAVGGATGVGGVTEQNLRRRTFKWYRRTYAQAELAPKLVTPFIEMVDPPAANMLVISNDHGNAAAGLDPTGAVSSLSFSIELAPPVADPAPPAQNVSINLTAGDTPAQVGAAIIAALPAGIAGEAFTNAAAFNSVNGSVDILITRADGKRILIRGETTNDTSLTVTVARVNLNAVDQGTNNTPLIPASSEFRRVIRASPGADDRMDCYVIGQFRGNGLRGRAFVAATDLPAAFQPPAPLRWATVMAANSSSGTVMDGTDNLPFTYPHESGHVLIDAFHTSSVNDAGAKIPFSPGGLEELMSTGTSPANAVNATKRICDSVHIKYAMFKPQPAATTGESQSVAISAVERLHTRGASVIEGW